MSWTFKPSLISAEDNASLLLDYVSDLVSSDKWHNSKDLYNSVFSKGKAIMKRYRIESSMIFVILKVLKIIREECSRVIRGNPELEPNMTNLLFAPSDIEVESVPRDKLREFLIEALEIFSSEVHEARSMIKESAMRYVDDGDVIVTYGYCDLVLEFLLYAAEMNRRFNVVVLEDCSPVSKGVMMAERLAQAGITVSLAPERASHALLSRAHKFITSCSSVFLDGAILCRGGIGRVCMDACAHNVPVYVCVPVSMVSPLLSLSHTSTSLCESVSTDDFIAMDKEVVPARFLDRLVTNIGPLEPAQVIAVSRDNFCTEDVNALLSPL